MFPYIVGGFFLKGYPQGEIRWVAFFVLARSRRRLFIRQQRRKRLSACQGAFG